MIRSCLFFVAMLSSASLLAHEKKSSVYASTLGTDVRSSRVVVVQVAEVFQKSKKAKKIQERVEAEVSKRISEIKAMEKPFTEKAEKLQREGRNMTQEKREALEGELASMKINIEIKQRGVQSYIQEQTEKAEKELIAEIQKVCDNLGYDIVFPGALYVRPGMHLDCTDEVVKKIDEGMATESMVKKLEDEVKSVFDKK